MKTLEKSELMMVNGGGIGINGIEIKFEGNISEILQKGIDLVASCYEACKDIGHTWGCLLYGDSPKQQVCN